MEEDNDAEPHPAELPQNVRIRKVDTPQDADKARVARMQAAASVLHSSEEWWRDRFNMLRSKGYLLRPRFRPDWIPSWKDTEMNPFYCDDGYAHLISEAIDATRLSDNKVVIIKRIRARGSELEIMEFLSSGTKLKDPKNHCVPCLGYFLDDDDEQRAYIVMPVLRDFNQPDFYAICEVMDFVQQTLEGLLYLHQQGVAHRDCADKNIMMDGTSLYPGGTHPDPSYSYKEPTGPGRAPSLRRAHTSPVKYYFIDFGISLRFDESSSEPRLAYGILGRQQAAPELQNVGDVYDPFLLDVFILGMVYREHILQKYSNTGFLADLVEAMTRLEPSARPTAQAAYDMFQQIKKTQGRLAGRRRLRKKGEAYSIWNDIVVVVFRDVTYAAKRTLRFLNPWARLKQMARNKPSFIPSFRKKS